MNHGNTKSDLTGHVLGALYLCAYWGKRYTVETIHPNGWVTVRWEDGHETTHCTRLEARDIRLMPATAQVVFDKPTEYVDATLATASWWDRYEILPGAYPFEWTRNGRPWNADPDVPTNGFIANVGPEDGTVRLKARLLEEYRVNRLFTASSVDHTVHEEPREVTLTKRVYAYQLPGCPNRDDFTKIASFLGGRVEALGAPLTQVEIDLLTGN